MLGRLGAIGAGVLTSAAMVVSLPVVASADPQSAGYQQHNLVSDQPGQATLTIPNFVNTWGLSHGPNTPVWVSNQGASNALLFNGAVNGSPVAQVSSVVVSIPGGQPTGQTFNDTTAFNVPGTTTPAHFIFAGVGGAISSWASGSQSVISGQDPGAIYTGLTLDHSPFGPVLLAADFHDNRIDVYDGQFKLQSSAGLFEDPHLPQGYAPFNVAEIGGKIYVTYAVQDANKVFDVPGQGHGIVDVYSNTGALLHRVATHGILNSPWGLTIAPANFGKFSNDLLIGNFGDGRIHAYDPQTGHPLGALTDPTGKPLAIDGLWSLLPGDPVAGGPDTLWFSAGPGEHHEHGLLGTLTAN
ncbi:MAG: TIGR03118 family protein [Mycobacterium sp.]|nr:TIGR03118 family protein [Mycobacterium sp.]